MQLVALASKVRPVLLVNQAEMETMADLEMTVVEVAQVQMLEKTM